MSLILPDAKNDVAQLVKAMVDKLGGFLPPGANAPQFFGSVISEANMLSTTLERGAIGDARTRNAFVKAAFNAAVVGLTPGASLGHAYFIPYKMRPKGATEWTNVNFIIGYRGFMELAFANDWLVQCDPELVLDGEDFQRWHDEEGPHVRHVIPLSRPAPTKENIVGAYCTYRSHGGGKGVVFVSREDLRQVDTGRNVWRDNYPAMAMKTPIRRAAKRWRLTRQLSNALYLDEIADRDEVQPCLAGDVLEEKRDAIDLNATPTMESGDAEATPGNEAEVSN